MDKYVEPHWQNAALLTIDVQNDFTLPDSTISQDIESLINGGAQKVGPKEWFCINRDGVLLPNLAGRQTSKDADKYDGCCRLQLP